MSIKTKMMLYSVVTWAMFSAAITVGWRDLVRTRNLVDSVFRGPVAVIGAGRDAEVALVDLRRHYLLWGRIDRSAWVAEYREIHNRLKTALDQGEAATHDGDVRSHAVAASAFLAQWDTNVVKESSIERERQLQAIVVGLQAEIGTFVTSARREDDVAFDELIRVVGFDAKVMVGLGGGAMLFGFLAAIIVGARVVRPMVAAAWLADQIAAGDLDNTVEVYSRDESGRLMSSLETVRVTLVRNEQMIQGQLEELRRLATMDQLTGLSNRRHLEEICAREIARAIRFEEPLSVVLIDVDHFKEVNDTYGHDVGDKVLISIAEVLGKIVRQVDVVGRWGGEEFLVICQRTEGEGAAILAEKVRAGIADYSFPVVGRKTASFGVSQYKLGEDLLDTVQRADKALYQSKSGGRNRVTLAG